MQFKLIIGLFLSPFSLVFGCAAAVRRFLYRKRILKSVESPVAAIDIGNLAVGGTGKTPHTQYVINLLKAEFHVAALSRGYGRKSSGYRSVQRTDPQDRTAEFFGDEPIMTHGRHPEIPLAVDANRAEGVRNLLSENPETDVVVLDDAYQHLQFRPSFHILLTEYDRPYRPDMPMPAGMLREFPRAARFADLVVVTKVPDDASVEESCWRGKLRLKQHQPLFFTRLRHLSPEPVTASAHNIDIRSLQGIVVVTGIAHPGPLLRHLSESFNITGKHVFPDHHPFSEKEIQEIYDRHFSNVGNNMALVTTEKDWMRLNTDHIRNIVSLLPVFVIPVEIEFLTEIQRNTFNQILIEHVRGKKGENSANS